MKLKLSFLFKLSFVVFVLFPAFNSYSKTLPIDKKDPTIFYKKTDTEWIKIKKVNGEKTILEKNTENPETHLSRMASEGLSSASTEAVENFNFFPNYYAVDVGSWPETVTIGDFNNDGKNDVVLGTGYYFDPVNDHSLFIFLQDGSCNLNTPIRINLVNPHHQSISSIKRGDMNGDGLDDIICGNYDRIEIFLQTDVGITTSSYSLPTDNSRWITIGDYNNDGLKDIAGISWSSNEVDIFLQQPDGLLVFSETLSVEYAGYNDIDTGDVNNDGLDDIVVMSGQSYAVDNIGILIQSIDGGFNEAVYYDNGRDSWGNASGVAVGDINDDTLSDVVISYGGNKPNSWIGSFVQNQVTNLLNPVIENNSYDAPESTEISDINNDGLNDIIVLHGGWNRVGIYFQNNDGTLSSEQLYTIPYASHYNPHGLAIGDINGDGSEDIVIADYNNGLVVLNNTFETPIADAGSYPTFNVDSDCQAIVTLDGSGSSDPNGDILTYVWSGPFPEGGGVVTGPSPTVTMPKGYSSITLTVDDGNCGIASDSAIIIVIDNIPPVISCLDNITVSNDPGVCGAVVPYTSPVGADNCPGATTSQTAGLGSGAMFPIGTTTETYTVIDMQGNSTSCSFTVTVNDTQNPTISCLSDITVSNDPGVCGAVVPYTSPVGTDNCPGATTSQTAGLGSGAMFPIGTTTETYTVTDVSGNSTSCSFTVTVNDTQDPTISCPSDISVSNDPGVYGAVVPYTSPVGTDNCPGATTSQTAGLGSGAMFPIGTTTETYTVTDMQGNTTSCSFTVTVNDTENPVITLSGSTPVDVEVGAAYTDAGATANDNLDGDITASIVTGGLPIDTSVLGIYTVTYDVTDSSGNVAVQVARTVNVVDTTVPVITLSGITPIDVEVGAAYTDAGATAADNVDGDISASILTTGLPIDTSTPGNYTVTYDVTDSSGNVAVQVTRTVNVIDTAIPVTISSVNFEAGWDIWNDGGSDARRSSKDAAYANSGSYCIRLRDNTSTSDMTTDNLDLSTYSQIEVQFSYYCKSMDNSNEDFWLQISTDGGSSFNTIEEWNRDDEFLNNERHNETVDIPGISLTSNTKLRFRCDASGNKDWVYIDDVIITAR